MSHSDSPFAVPRQGSISLGEFFQVTEGGLLRNADIFYERYGEMNADRSNVILVFTGLSASAHARSHELNPTRGWWEMMIGDNKALDTKRFCVLLINSLGSCFGSTGPGSINPDTTKPYGFDFPTLRIEDIARAAQIAVDKWGIKKLYATIGMSLGGMTVLAHRALYPHSSERLISISGALQATTLAVATRSLQREILGIALKTPGSGLEIRQAIKWARKIGILSYIGADLLEKRYHRDQNEPYSGNPSGTDFEVEGWLEHLANRFADTFNPYSYWTLSRAMDLFSFPELERTLRATTPFRLGKGKALVIGVQEDQLFPIASQAEVAQKLAVEGIPTQFERLSSPYGHDAFLTERGLFEPILQSFLDT